MFQYEKAVKNYFRLLSFVRSFNMDQYLDSRKQLIQEHKYEPAVVEKEYLKELFIKIVIEMYANHTFHRMIRIKLYYHGSVVQL